MPVSAVLVAQNLKTQGEMNSCLLQRLRRPCKRMAVKCNTPWNVLVWTCCCLSVWLAVCWERNKEASLPLALALPLPCSLIYLGHKDSFPALALCCPLAPSKSTKRSIVFPSLLFFILFNQRLSNWRIWEEVEQMPPYSSLRKAVWHTSSPTEKLRRDAGWPGFAVDTPLLQWVAPNPRRTEAEAIVAKGY